MDCYLINIRLVTKQVNDEEQSLFNHLEKIATEAVNTRYITPLDNTIGLCEKLLADTNLRSKVQARVREIHTNTNALLIQVNDVLDGITLKHSHLNRKAELFNPNDRITRIVEIANATRSKNQQVEIRSNINLDKSLKLWGDAARIDQIVLNLVQFCL
jgi:signal transduction histidine kinase